MQLSFGYLKKQNTHFWIYLTKLALEKKWMAFINSEWLDAVNENKLYDWLGMQSEERKRIVNKCCIDSIR